MASSSPSAKLRHSGESTAAGVPPPSLISSDTTLHVAPTINIAPTREPHNTNTGTLPRGASPLSLNLDFPLRAVAFFYFSLPSSCSGLIRTPPLPYFPASWHDVMAPSRQYQIPSTPRVISPSPTPSEAGSGKDGYFPPVTRSSTRKSRQRVQSPQAIDEYSSGSDPEKRARPRSRSPILEGGLGLGRRRMSGLTARRQSKQMNGGLKKDKQKELTLANGTALANGTIANGHLTPAQANKNYWREMSRSPSPLGLIPIHQKWRSFVSTHSTSEKLDTDNTRSTGTRFPARSFMSPSASSPSSSTVLARRLIKSTTFFWQC